MTELRALLVTPLSGPLGRFGRAGASALRLWAAESAHLPSPWRGVQLDLEDAHPDAAAAMKHGLARKPDLIFGPYGSGPALQALAAADRVIWNHGGASSSVRWPAFPRVVNVLAPASSYFRGTLEAVRSVDPEARRVVILHATTGFGIDVARGAAETARELGFGVTARGFSRGEAVRTATTLPDAEVLLVVGSFEDELESAPVLLRRTWRAVGFVGAGVDEVLAPLGEAREGLLGPAQWIATTNVQPDEGPDVNWFLARYRSCVRSDPPYPAAQAFAAGVLAALCLREYREGPEAGVERQGMAPADARLADDAMLAAARRLACRTLYGDFRLDPVTGLQIGHQVVTVQWQEGRRRAIWPPDIAQAGFHYPLERVGRRV